MNYLAHGLLSLLAYGLFSLAFICGLLYLFQERWLKTKPLNLLRLRLPALDRLELWSIWLVSTGFVCLTLGIMVGVVWSQAIHGAYLLWRPKELLALLTWLVFGLYLFGHHQLGWSRHRLVYVLLGSTLASMLAFLAVRPW